MISNTIKKFLCTMFIIGASNFMPGFVQTTLAEKGRIITRSGQIMDVEIIRLMPTSILFKNKKNGKEELIVNKNDLYMYSTQLTGNIYIDKEGKERAGEPYKSIDKMFTTGFVYSLDGTMLEISSFMINHGDNTIRCNVKKDNLVYTDIKSIDDIFLINEINGSTYVMNILDSPSNSKILDSPDSPNINSLSSNENRETQNQIDDQNLLSNGAQEDLKKVEGDDEEANLELKFYEVQKGETLNKIASKFNVIASDIIEWNDMSPKIKTNVVLQEGTQLLIYVPFN